MCDTPYQSDLTTRNIVVQMLIREQGRSHLLERCDLKASSPHRWKSTCVNPNTKTHRASFRILLLAQSSFFFFATPHLLWFPDLQKEVGNLTTPPPWPDKSGCPSSHQTHLGHRGDSLRSQVWGSGCPGSDQTSWPERQGCSPGAGGGGNISSW